MAILSPNPVLTNPRAKKKEITINQITSLVKALNAVENDKVLVTMVVVRPRKAQAPTGNGDKTSPAMVERNIEKSCHASGVTSSGCGMKKRTIKPTPSETTKGTIFAPCNWNFGDSMIDLSSFDDDAEKGLMGFGSGVRMEGLEVVKRKRR